MLFCKKIVCVYFYYIIHLRMDELYKAIPELIMISILSRYLVNHNRPPQQQNTLLSYQGTEVYNSRSSCSAWQHPIVINTNFKDPPLYIDLDTLPMCPRNIVY